MGKKSLIKSTAKKKTKSAKKDEVKKTVKKAKVASKAKTTATAKTTAKAKTTKTKTTTKTKVAAKTRSKKTVAAAKKKKVSLKDLILKKFEVWKPAEVFRVAVDEEYLKNYVSPPIVSGLSDKEAKRIKGLLLKKRDMATIRAEIKKAAAEREAAEKVVAEKAAAEKAAAEKAAAERAAAEKASAEREAAEKATMKKVIIGLAAGFIILVALIFSSSASNNSKYYIKERDGALEIWQGRYAPLGEERIMTLSEMQSPGQINTVYSEAELFPLIFNYYIDKADDLSVVSDTPDYVAIKSYLNKALSFAITGDLRKKAYARLNDIKFNDLMYKAGVAENRGTISDLDEAIRCLNKASLLRADAGKSGVVKQKIKSIKEQRAEIEAQVAEESAI